MIRRLPSDAVLLVIAVCAVLAVMGGTLLLHHVLIGDVDVTPVVPARFAVG